MGDQSLEIKTAISAARAAEEIIMHYYGGDYASRLKPDHTPVTQADEEAEEAIARTIRAQFPEHGFLGEETGEQDRASDYCWIVDPVDGTKNYIRGIPLFGTQIALMHRGVLQLGVSNMPAMGELLHAERGQGAYLNGMRVKVSDVGDLGGAQVSFGGLDYFDAAGRLDAAVTVVRGAGRIRAFGDAYAYHLVATGRCEAVLEAHIKIWDIAALSVIVEEAGGRCTDLDGVGIGTETGSMLATNGRVHEKLLAVF